MRISLKKVSGLLSDSMLITWYTRSLENYVGVCQRHEKSFFGLYHLYESPITGQNSIRSRASEQAATSSKWSPRNSVCLITKCVPPILTLIDLSSLAKGKSQALGFQKWSLGTNSERIGLNGPVLFPPFLNGKNSGKTYVSLFSCLFSCIVR